VSGPSARTLTGAGFLGVSIRLTTNNQPIKIMKKSPLPHFTRFLQQQPEDGNHRSFYETNKELARDIGVVVSYENLGCNFWDLVNQAPEDLSDTSDSNEISLDILWAEEQLEIAFDLA